MRTFIALCLLFAAAESAIGACPSNRTAITLRARLQGCRDTSIGDLQLNINGTQREALFEGGFWFVRLSAADNPVDIPCDGIVPVAKNVRAYCLKGREVPQNSGGSIAHYEFTCDEEIWQFEITATVPANVTMMLTRRAVGSDPNACFVYENVTPYTARPMTYAAGQRERVTVDFLTKNGEVISSRSLTRADLESNNGVIRLDRPEQPEASVTLNPTMLALADKQQSVASVSAIIRSYPVQPQGR